jgi:UDP-2,3-diacylglucosamine hydrolase
MVEANPMMTADEGPLAIICGGGSLPFAVADAVVKLGRPVVLFGLRGCADPQRVAAYPHHWASLGQFGLLCRLARRERCRDVVFIGSVPRPALWRLRPDFKTLRLLPRVVRLFAGGDDHLLTGIADIFEEHGFRLIGAHEVAPDILMPQGALGRVHPGGRDRADIAKGLALLRATSPFDVGQAVVVADGHVLAVEAAEGTDRMLANLAALRVSNPIAATVHHGVLVKAAKQGQDRRVDLPSIGPQTVEGAGRAALAGIAVVAGSAVIAEPERVAAAAERAGLFVIGVRDDASEPSEQ